MNNYNKTSAMSSLRGAQNRAEGNAFEKLITTACEYYEEKGIALIEKTPEPFHVTRNLKNGKFEGYFTKKAQPDFKGTIRSGKSIVFDAKATETDRINLSALTDEQVKRLELHRRLGAETAILLCFGFKEFAWIPFEIFMAAKDINGHKHWTIQESRDFAVYLKNGYLDFLSGRRIC